MAWELNRQSIERDGSFVDPHTIKAYAVWKRIGDPPTKVEMTVYTRSLSQASRLFEAMVKGMNREGVK